MVGKTTPDFIDAGAANVRQFGRKCPWVRAPVGRPTFIGNAGLDKKRGNQPPEATGLQLSRRDVLVTSFGVDPGTQKLMLRLWEQAGKDGPCVITLPRGLAVRAVQPCDLRGRPVGDPIAVKSGRLRLHVRHYAPLNLELIRSTTTGGSGT
jgi:hypothetical protein